ncbi:MAG: hypothetical protein HN742_34990 [Lentisphaerae bacterium]|jgi:hypothetical protein|nr:hypothetical protein [Lentisphaerota bacterium]MBT4822434.1 hypothetical protein [Lentisphaerota bacterium]MBT5609224.1 hypothetical protein [Lentisphaerota bacterium]MBT7059897.1 hypothetical protein [Lentisphaerota bacterium]MBT7847130.1 hypothetical protein [Lentisphaerota bacterium]
MRVRRAALPVGLAVLFLCGRTHAEPTEPMAYSRYLIRATSAVTVTLPSKATPSCHYRSDAGVWTPVPDVHVRDGRLTLQLSTSQLGPDAEAAIVINRPPWMVLTDTAPPRLREATVNGMPCNTIDGVLRPQPLAAKDVVIRLRVQDADNPLSPSSVHWTGEGLTCSSCILSPSEQSPQPMKEGLLTATFRDVRPGLYRGSISITDQAAWPNKLSLPVTFSVIGIDVSADKQRVTLSNSGGEYVFQPDLAKQLLLPGGTWAKLTSRMGSTWLYPRRITDVQIRKEPNGTQGALITTDVQDIKGKEAPGLALIEYDLSIRPDTPALLVTTRSTVISEGPQRTSANWGWLPAAYYVTPEGKQEWRGLARNEYITIGKIGWLWLAPKAPGKQPGLVWASESSFGESRFNTMLLYGTDKTCKTADYVEVKFAIAPADSAEEGQAIVDRLNARR